MTSDLARNVMGTHQKWLLSQRFPFVRWFNICPILKTLPIPLICASQVNNLLQLFLRLLFTTSSGMCNKCGLKVVGENSGCTAMDKVYHIECFTCQTCSQKLRGQPFYALEGGAFCENCYINSLEKCSTCSKPITDRVKINSSQTCEISSLPSAKVHGNLYRSETCSEYVSVFVY